MSKSDNIDRDEIQQRLTYLGFDEKDDQNLAIIHERLKAVYEPVLDDFYEHLQEYPEPQRLIKDEEALVRLKNAQRAYLEAMGSARTEPEYFEDRLQIGKTHEGLGLKLDWYLGAYSWLFQLLGKHLLTHDDLTPEEYRSLLTSINKVFWLDASIAVDAYYNATKDRLEGLLSQLSDTQKTLEIQSRQDELTGLSNRRHLLESLEMEIYRSKRFHHPFTVLLLDIDHFKEVNDDFGHQFGDYVLNEMAALIQKMVRPSNIIGRYGGEEFSIGLVECTLKDAQNVADRLRLEIFNTEFSHEGHSAELTVSIGLSEMSSKSDTLNALIQEADQALYAAKRGGRNRVCIYEG